MTIAPELSARILRLYDVEKWRVGTISRLLCVHRDTVHRVLAQSGLPTPSTPLRPSRIDAYRPFILETLTKFPELSAVRLFGMVSERGYRGSGEHFRHLIAGMRPRPAAEAYLRLRTLPGEHPVHGVAVHAQQPGDGADAPLLDLVQAQDPRAQLRGYGHGARPARGPACAGSPVGPRARGLRRSGDTTARHRARPRSSRSDRDRG